MELDKLKDTWEKVSEIDAKPSDEQILNLLKTSNKSIWNGIVIKEKIGFIIGLIFCILYLLILEKIDDRFYSYLICVAFFIVIPIWQLFKWMYLKKIDMINSDILSISKYLNKYRDYNIFEGVMIIIFTILFFVVFSIETSRYFSIFKVGGFFLALGFLAFFTTRYRYKTTIGKIKRNLEEMKSFEKEE